MFTAGRGADGWWHAQRQTSDICANIFTDEITSLHGYNERVGYRFKMISPTNLIGTSNVRGTATAQGLSLGCPRVLVINRAITGTLQHR